jgi:hypothetical protein
VRWISLVPPGNEKVEIKGLIVRREGQRYERKRDDFVKKDYVAVPCYDGNIK